MLSGQADLESTIAAVNEGRVFRFLLKPCDSETLFGVIKNGIDQYRLIHAEKHLLENTLNATVKVLFDVLGLINPAAQRRAAQIQRYAESGAVALKLLPGMWQYHLAAMVSQLGCITLPQETLSRAYGGQPLTEEEAGCTNRIRKSPASCSARFRASKPSPAWSRARCGAPPSDLADGDPATWEPAEDRRRDPVGRGQFDRHSSTRAASPSRPRQLVELGRAGLPPAITQAMVNAAGRLPAARR